MELQLEIAGVTGRVALLEDKAPQTVRALLTVLPIADRGVQVRWSGDAWRAENDYDLGVTEVENEGYTLGSGDLIYYPRGKKIGLAYGTAQWRHSDPSIKLHVSVIGKVTTNLDGLVKASRRALKDGAQPIRLSR